MSPPEIRIGPRDRTTCDHNGHPGFLESNSVQPRQRRILTRMQLRFSAEQLLLILGSNTWLGSCDHFALVIEFAGDDTPGAPRTDQSFRLQNSI
jgi:hypothetical protein